MPGIIVFRRRWSVGSDDLVVPGIFLLILHSVWIIVLAVILGVVASGTQVPSPCMEDLHQHIIGYLVILSGCVIVEACIAYIAMRGTILDPSPRAYMQYLLYIRLALLVVELIWVILGVIWLTNHYNTCPSTTARNAILGIVICNWFVFASVLLTVWCTFDAAGRSWVKMKKYQRSMKDSSSKYQYKRSGNRNRNWRQRKVLKAYQDSWDNRCRLLLCCTGSSDRSRQDSYGDIARLFSEFFRDLDVVPSDVVAGLVLLRKFQKLERKKIVANNKNDVYAFLSGVPITPRTKFLQLSSPEGQEEFRKIVHFMRFALAVYGWPMYLVTSSAAHKCDFCPFLSCFRHASHSFLATLVEDNCCGCNTAALLSITPQDGVDLIYVTYHVDVGEIPFFVALDHTRKADVITDLNAESDPLPLDIVKEDWLGHKGMVAAAEYIRRKIRDENLLGKAFGFDTSRGTTSYDLVLVGHSLGAGAAAILAILLKQEHPNLCCFAYSFPGGLLSYPAMEYTKAFITSVVVGKDFVPRIGLHQFETLRADLINSIKLSRDPKWKIIAGSMRCCRGEDEDEAEVEMWSSTRGATRNEGAHPSDSSIALTVHQPLYPPGRILHIVRNHPDKKQQCCESTKPVYQAIWVDNEDFDEVLISPCMIQDHMPDKVLKALEMVLESKGPAKPQRLQSSVKVDVHDSSLDTDRVHLLTSPQTPASLVSATPTALPLGGGPLKMISSLSSSGKLVTPPHKLLLETSFACSPQSSPEPLTDIRKYVQNYSPVLTWDLLSALEEQILIGIRGTQKDTADDWLSFAPLASPETLSEASSIASRASILLRNSSQGNTASFSSQSPALRRPTRLGKGYCFYVDCSPPNLRHPPLHDDSSDSSDNDDDVPIPHTPSPTSYVTIEPIIHSSIDTSQKSDHCDSGDYECEDVTRLIKAKKIPVQICKLQNGLHKNQDTKSNNVSTTFSEEHTHSPHASNLSGFVTPESMQSQGSSDSVLSTDRLKDNLTMSQHSKDSGYGERTSAFENESFPMLAKYDVESGNWGCIQQEYGVKCVPLAPHYLYSGNSPQLSPVSFNSTATYPPDLPSSKSMPQFSPHESRKSSHTDSFSNSLFEATPLLHDLVKLSEKKLDQHLYDKTLSSSTESCV